MPTQPFVLDPRQLHLLSVMAEPASIVLQDAHLQCKGPMPSVWSVLSTRAFVVSPDAGQPAVGQYTSPHSAVVTVLLL